MISFIVPAYNEERYLGATLEAIHAAALSTGEAYEIVVADDASTDGTAAVAEAGGARVVHVHNRQIAATRNAGVRAAAGDVLIFVDADTRVSGPLVAGALAALRAGAVGGGAPVRLDGAPAWANAFMRAFVPLYFRLARWAAGCFLFCTRVAFDAAGGFDERYYASEEIHLSRALKRQGRFVMLETPVTSSSRKLEGRTAGDMLWMLVRLAAGGREGLRARSGATAFWYPDRR
ncbi:MAG TPA: glycosyltransferase [Usitatibacter sp.]|nr:glycosyltransferase [Usitatibacter sp.]